MQRESTRWWRSSSLKPNSNNIYLSVYFIPDTQTGSFSSTIHIARHGSLYSLRSQTVTYPSLWTTVYRLSMSLRCTKVISWGLRLWVTAVSLIRSVASKMAKCILCTVPFHSVRQSRVTGHLASLKCHGSHDKFCKVPNLFCAQYRKNSSPAALNCRKCPKTWTCHGKFGSCRNQNFGRPVTRHGACRIEWNGTVYCRHSSSRRLFVLLVGLAGGACFYWKVI
jgi:hypothetical protein